jgi:hypothetical protein
MPSATKWEPEQEIKTRLIQDSEEEFNVWEMVSSPWKASKMKTNTGI